MFICVSGGRSSHGRRASSFTRQEATSNHQFPLCAIAFFFFFFLLFPGTATDLRCSVWLQIAPGQWWPLPARSVRCGLQPPLTPGSPLRFSRTVKISTYFSCRNLPLHRLWFSDVDFDGILVHELMQFLIICVHFRHREVDYSSFF